MKPQKAPRQGAVQCVVVSSTRIDANQFLVTLACGSYEMKASSEKPRSIRMKCRTCEARARKANP